MRKINIIVVTVVVFMLLAHPVRAEVNDYAVRKWLNNELHTVTRELVIAWVKGEDKDVIDNLLGSWMRLQIQIANRSGYVVEESYFQKLDKIQPPEGFIPAKILGIYLKKEGISTDIRSVLAPVLNKRKEVR